MRSERHDRRERLLGTLQAMRAALLRGRIVAQSVELASDLILSIESIHEQPP